MISSRCDTSDSDALICKTQLWGIGVLKADRAPLNTHVPVNGSCPETLIVRLAHSLKDQGARQSVFAGQTQRERIALQRERADPIVSQIFRKERSLDVMRDRAGFLIDGVTPEVGVVP